MICNYVVMQALGFWFLVGRNFKGPLVFGDIRKIIPQREEPHSPA